MDNNPEQIFILNPSVEQASTSAQKIIEVAPARQVNLEDVEDFSTVCRTCASITEFVIPVFSGEGLQNNLADKIHKHLPIKVSIDDSLPTAVCYQCAHTLLAWHELVACCRQADAALRTRLRQMQHKEQKSARNKNGEEEAKNKEQKEFEAIVDFVVRAPPAYPPALAACSYCGSRHPPDALDDHLLAAHSHLLFHCDECDKFVDKKDFLLHMSVHAVELANDIKKDEPKKKKVKKRKETKDDNTENTQKITTEQNVEDEKDKPEKSLEKNVDPIVVQQDEQPVVINNETTIENPVDESISDQHIEKSYFNLEKPLDERIEEIIVEPNTDTIIDNRKSSDKLATVENSVINNAENEFSDPSDAEYEFGPLPESVFEAIEDSQDNHPLENEQFSTPKTREDETLDNNTNDSTIQKTENKRNRPRTCPICLKVYTAPSSYFYHMKYAHKQIKDHECKICGSKFVSKVSLNQHTQLHTGKTEFECSVCGKKFKSNASLYIHEQLHTGVKTYSCDQCQVSFRWRTHLMRHMKRHAAEKSHVCPTCGRGFSIHYDLLRHIRTHNAGSFSCEKCGVKFTQSRYLKVHMYKKHSTKTEVKCSLETQS